MRGDTARKLARPRRARLPTENEKLMGMAVSNLNRRAKDAERRLARLEGIFLRIGVDIEEGLSMK